MHSRPAALLANATRCRDPFDRVALVADRDALVTPQSGQGFPRVTRQNRASVALRLRPYEPPSDQAALGRVPCRPTLSSAADQKLASPWGGRRPTQHRLQLAGGDGGAANAPQRRSGTATCRQRART
jgi:hypothetical protein